MLFFTKRQTTRRPKAYVTCGRRAAIGRLVSRDSERHASSSDVIDIDVELSATTLRSLAVMFG